MELTSSVMVNLLSSLLWLAIGALIYRFVVVPLQRSRTALSRLLRFQPGKRITICYGIIPPNAGSIYYTVAEGDLAAINHVHGTLAAYFGNERIRTMNFHAVQGSLSSLSNVVSVSGPRWNHVTELLIGRLGSPISFNQTEGLIIAGRDGTKTEYRTVRRPDGDEETCYGFVCVGDVDTPTGERQRVAICAGLNTLSTYGAVVFLAALGNMYSLRRYPALSPRRVGRRWAAVLRVENLSNPRTSDPSRNPLEPHAISIDVVAVLGEQSFHDPFAYRY